jgi:uncharacterized membrane protein YkoI
VKHSAILSAFVITLLTAGSVAAQGAGTANKPAAKPTATKASAPAVQLKEAAPGLAAQATVKLDDARATALKKQAGNVVSERIEKRGAELVYVFGIKSSDKTHHVMVDAKTGNIVEPQAKAQNEAKPGTAKK